MISHSKIRNAGWCEGWIAGFAAAALLYSNRYDDYAKDRDEWLRRKGWAPPAEQETK